MANYWKLAMKITYSDSYVFSITYLLKNNRKPVAS